MSLDNALALAKKGFAVTPLLHNTSDAFVSGWPEKASSDPKVVEATWPTGSYNVGVVTGREHRGTGKYLFVLDEDNKGEKRGAVSLCGLELEHGDLPETLTVRSPSSGRHRYFLADTPVGNSASKIGAGLDIKGWHGQVAAPGSTKPNGAYVVELDAPIADAPEWLIRLAGAPRERKADSHTSLVELNQPHAVKRATDWLSKSAPDHGTYRVACKVRAYGVSEDRALELILEHWPPADAKGSEHVAIRVGNAFAYAQDPAGKEDPGAEFTDESAAVAARETTAPKRRGLYYVRWCDVVADLEQPYLIDDVMDLGSMVVTYGDSNAGKTYVVLDQAFSVASSKEWNGHKVRSGLVVYVAAEGGRGFAKRVEAFRRQYGATDIPFALVPCPIDLQSDRADTKKLIAVIREAEADFGQKCVLVVLDTLSRVMGGGDENTAVDMSKFVGHADRLRDATGATVNVIHHTGKDKAKGARGSSALRAATDTELEVADNTLTVKKQRDMGAGKPARFELKQVQVGTRSDGKTVDACVVEWSIVSEFEPKISPLAREFYAILCELVEAKADKADEGIAWDDWRNVGLARIRTIRGTPPSSTYWGKFRRELENSAMIEEVEPDQWTTRN